MSATASAGSGVSAKATRPFANHHNEVERQIIVTLVEALLAAGYLVGVNDGEEKVLDPCSDAGRIFSVMSTTDEDYLLTKKEGEKNGWIRLVYGNGADVISDYTVNVPEAVFEAANELSDRFSGGGRS